MIRRWLTKRRAEREARAFEDGYAFGAGVLLKSNGTDDPVDYICPPETAFDRGIREACLDWRACTGRPVGVPS